MQSIRPIDAARRGLFNRISFYFGFISAAAAVVCVQGQDRVLCFIRRSQTPRSHCHNSSNNCKKKEEERPTTTLNREDRRRSDGQIDALCRHAIAGPSATHKTFGPAHAINSFEIPRPLLWKWPVFSLNWSWTSFAASPCISLSLHWPVVAADSARMWTSSAVAHDRLCTEPKFFRK